MSRYRNLPLRNALSLLILMASCLSFGSSTARADEPYALITIGMHRVFDKVLPALEAASGRKFRIEYASTIEIAQRLIGGARADLVVASRAGVNRLIDAHKVMKNAQFDLGGSQIVIAVPKGWPSPDISSVEGVKNAMLAARNISYTDPASGGPSGVHMACLLDQLGISEQVNAKTRFPPAGGPVGDVLARGEADIGIQQSVELTSFPGVDVVGPLPADIQALTNYVLAIPNDARQPDAGTSLLEFLRSAKGQRLLLEAGLDPKWEPTLDHPATASCRPR